MKAEEIIALLKAKHSEDVFVPECKSGPSAGHEHLRLDAWVMAKSWTRPMTWGYEVKVTRADFLADQKMGEYMRYCSQFYVVCPKGVADVTEIPNGAGLIYVVGTGTGARLMTALKAQIRRVEIPENLFRYILMCRAHIGKGEEQPDKTRYWLEFLERKEKQNQVGHKVRKAIREEYLRAIDEASDLRSKYAQYDSVREVLVQLGWKEPDKEWVSARALQNRLDGNDTNELLTMLGHTRRQIDFLEAKLKEKTAVQSEARKS